MFSFDPINRHRYGFVMVVASGLLVVIINNFAKFAEVVAQVAGCQNRGLVCNYLEYRFPDQVGILAISLFLLVVAIATLRRLKETSISNYWIVLLSVMIFLDHSYLSGSSGLQIGSLNHSLIGISVPWFMLVAASLVFLLTVAPDRSNYILDGYWKADPPLGFGLAISSFWLLSISAPRALAIVANALGNYQLVATSQNTQHQLESMLPAALISPVIPAVVFVTCAALLAVLGSLKGENPKPDLAMEHQRLQNATTASKAAQRFKTYH